MLSVIKSIENSTSILVKEITLGGNGKVVLIFEKRGLDDKVKLKSAIL